MRRLKRFTGGAALLGVLGLGGCAGLGGLGGWEDVLGGMGLPGGSQVRGEVSYVDTRSREIELRSGWSGSTRVDYDRNTEVIYQQRRYSVSDLERGDVVSIQVQQGRQGELYADRIYVERSAREGDRRDDRYPESYPGGRVQRFEGRVLDVDERRGRFSLDTRSERFTVTLPYDPSASTRDRFRRLRRGDSVRIEGELLSRERVELLRFR